MKIDNRYEVSGKLGHGAFSKVYSATDIITGGEVAIKIDLSNIQSGKRRKPLAEYEAAVLQEIHAKGRVRGVPRLFWNGKITTKSGEYPAIIIDRLGQDLENVLEFRKKLSLTEAAKIGISLLDILKKIHKSGFIHRDLKPANIMLGFEDNNVYIADFGLSKRFVNSSNKHIPFCDNKSGVTGTMRYCSTYTHFGVESSRRDDMQSLLFIVVYLTNAELPWQSKNIKKGNVGSVKSKCVFDGSLTKNMNPHLHRMNLNIKNIQFSEEPNYKFLRTCLENIVAEN